MNDIERLRRGDDDIYLWLDAASLALCDPCVLHQQQESQAR